MKLPLLLVWSSICATACATTGVLAPQSVPSDRLFVSNRTPLFDLANVDRPGRSPAGHNHYHAGFSASGGYELGEVDDFINRIDDLQSDLTLNTRQLSLKSYINAYGFDGEAIGNAVVSDLNVRVIDIVNQQIALITADSSYATVFGSLGAPVYFSQRGLDGNFVFTTNVTAARDLWAVGDPLKAYTVSELEEKILAALNSDEPSVDYLLPETDTALVVRTAFVDTMSLTYQRSIAEFPTGQLLAGLRGNYYKVKLSRYAKRLTDFAREELSNDYQNDYTYENASFHGAPGLDAGVTWIMRRYRIAATLNNINQPRFRYNRVDTSDYSSTDVPQRLNEDRTWKMTTQLRLEGALNSLDRRWSLGTAFDGNTIKDPLGHEYRWVSAGAAYTPHNTWIPGLRVGYHANTSGSEVRYMTTGLTVFNTVSLDMARSLESVTIEKNDAVSYHGRAPRSLVYLLRVELGI